MSVRGGVFRPVAALCVLLAAGGCASVLDTPPPALEEMADERAVDASRALADARAAWARRPDPVAVRDAAASYLAAAAAASGGDGRVDALLGAARVHAWIVEHEDDRARRIERAETVVQSGQHCVEAAPASAACEYWLAVGLGLLAREKPAGALPAVSQMIDILDGVARREPGLERGGPNRVLALVYLRAPGWPIGPGDPEQALVRARLALDADGRYPPNLLAAGEALERLSRRAEARAMYERALAEARRLAERGDPDGPEWMRQAEAALEEASGV